MDCLRERITTIAPDLDAPPDQDSSSRFAAKVSDGLGARTVVARHQDLVAVSDPRATRRAGAATPPLPPAARC